MDTDRGRSRAKDFGLALKLARVRAGDTQAELAEKVDVHATAVSQWERGDRADIPSVDKVEALDAALGAEGKLIEAAGYNHSGSYAPVEGGYIPIPRNLTADDVAALLSIARQISQARAADPES